MQPICTESAAEHQSTNQPGYSASLSLTRKAARNVNMDYFGMNSIMYNTSKNHKASVKTKKL